MVFKYILFLGVPIVGVLLYIFLSFLDSIVPNDPEGWYDLPLQLLAFPITGLLFLLVGAAYVLWG